MKLSLIILLIFVCAVSGSAQNNILLKSKVATHPKLIKTQGSSEYDAVGCGMQDRKGNIWFGTAKEGVYRYDGKTFTNYTAKDGLGSNTVTAILEDRNGDIWFACSAGVCRYNQYTQTILPIAISDGSYFAPTISLASNSSQRHMFTCMLQDKSGTVWLGTSDGVYCYNGATFTRFSDNGISKDGTHLRYVVSMLQDRNGNIWFTTWFDGVCRYDGKNLTSFKPNGEVWYAAIMEDKNGDIWVGRRSKGACRYDGKTFTNVVQGGLFDSCCVTAIAKDEKGNIWFGTEADNMTQRETKGGVWRYDGSGFRNFGIKDGVSNPSVWCLVIDKAGNVWAGTRNTGLYRYNAGPDAPGKGFISFSE